VGDRPDALEDDRHQHESERWRKEGDGERILESHHRQYLAEQRANRTRQNCRGQQSDQRKTHPHRALVVAHDDNARQD
jgi:hypothetical protein